MLLATKALARARRSSGGRPAPRGGSGTEPNDKKEDPPPPDGAQPTRKRGRPRKDEERPKPEPTRLERQTTQNLDQMLADLPTACDVGSKKNSKGYDLRGVMRGVPNNFATGS